MTWACNGLNPATTICLGNMSTWNGITCEDGCITEIILDGSQLVNGNRKERVLWIENNVQLAGTLVSAIGNLLSLRSLALPYNLLAGQIPSTIGRLINLQTLNLMSNHLTGPIPPSISSLTKLQSLLLTGNTLSGTLPSSLCQSLTSLSYQWLANTNSNVTLCHAPCLNPLLNVTSPGTTCAVPSATPSQAPLLTSYCIK